MGGNPYISYIWFMGYNGKIKAFSYEEKSPSPVRLRKNKINAAKRCVKKWSDETEPEPFDQNSKQTICCKSKLWRAFSLSLRNFTFPHASDTELIVQINLRFTRRIFEALEQPGQRPDSNWTSVGWSGWGCAQEMPLQSDTSGGVLYTSRCW